MDHPATPFGTATTSSSTKSIPPAVAVDLVDSFARISDDQVRIVLARPASSAAAVSEIVLRNGSHRLVAPAVVEERHGTPCLTASYAIAQLSNGVWRVRGRVGEARPFDLGCRLLVQDDRPLALLWGAQAVPSETRVVRTTPPAPRTAPHPSSSVGGHLRRWISSTAKQARRMMRR